MSIYDRIKQKEREIKEMENNLDLLVLELKELYTERDRLEFERLIQQAKKDGLSAEEVLLKLHKK